MRRTGELCLLALLVSRGVWAQAGAGSGTVTGTVLEAAGDGLPDATVVLSNAALGLRRVMATSDDGVFDARALIPSAGYRIKITRKGFTDWDSGEFEVAVGQTVEFQVDLNHADESGKGGNTTTSAPRVLETKNGITTLVSAQQMDTLPSRDRRLDPLVLVAPLTSTDHRSGRLVLAGEPSSNLFLTDGVAITNTYNGARPGLGNQFSQETMQEFQVLTANYSAEFGSAQGGIVNAATRNGSNHFHGAGYEYFTNHSLAAANRYALGDSLLRHQNQAGATLGGPVRRDRVFFFSNFEVLDGQGQGLNRITNQTITDATGSTIPAGNCKATTIQCAQAIQFIQRQMNVLTPLSERWVSGMAKVDYRRSERNSFSILGNAANTRAPGAGGIEEVAANGGLLGLNNTDRHIRYGKAAWTSAPTPNTLSEIRFGIFDDRIFDPASSAGLSTGNSAITVAGATVGNPRPNSSMLSERRYQLTGNFTATSNTHSFTAGADLWRTRDTIDSLSAGEYIYPSLTAFAQDFTSGGKSYTSFHQQLGTSLRALPMRQYNLYAFDTWRPFASLTLLAGVRFEKPLLPQPSQVNTNYYQTGSIASPNIDFAPRISAAYRASDRTVVRVGYGWFYEPIPGRLLDALFLGNGVYQPDLLVTPNLTGAPVFPNVFPNGVAASSIPAGSTNLMFASSKLRNPYVRETTAAIETRLDRKTTLTISALHSRGFKRWTVSDVNLAAPTVTKTYAIDNAAGQQTDSYSTLIWNTRNDSRYGHIYSVENGGSSWYNAGVAELRRNLSSGLTVQATYTWSHAITDTGGPTLAGFLPVNANNGDVASERADSPLDQRHRGVVNWTWQPTERLLRGWAVSGIATMASGQPETAVVAVAGQQFSGVTMAYTSSLNGSGGWARVPFSPIGGLHTGAQYNVDARISRSINLREGVRAVLMFEAFNAFNTQFDTAVNTIAFTATPTSPPTGAVNGPATGILRPVPGLGAGIAAGPARQCQVALRITF